jgi:glycosyltransferase involved in cell wall biosynthesis
MPPPLRRKYHSKVFSDLQDSLGCRFDLIWSFDYSRMFDLDVSPAGCFTICHMADFTARLPWRIAAASARLCLGVTFQMVRDLKSVNPNSFFLNHGVADFEILDFGFETESPNVVYAGNLSIPFLDHERLLCLIKSYGSVNFHFFGDTGTGNLSRGQEGTFVRTLRKQTNAHVHGPVPASRLPGIYQRADALLLCYDSKHGDLVANSHKVMEYLASGKPILATPMEVYEQQGHLISMHQDREAYCQALSLALEEDSPTLSRQRRKFALDHTYKQQIARVEALVQSVS